MALSNSNISGRGRDRPLTGRTVLVSLLAFFGVVASVNALMIRLATSTFGGVETANAYQAGLAFSREIAAAQSQNARHWRVDASVSVAQGETLIELTGSDANGLPLANVRPVGRLAHPTDRRADRILSFDAVTSGKFQARTDALHGQWLLEVDLLRAGERLFRSRNRVFLR